MTGRRTEGGQHDRTLSQYVGPTEIVHRHGKSYVYDAGAGEIIAELTPEAAEAVRTHTPSRMAFDGKTLALED
jgi:hypothetical protein